MNSVADLLGADGALARLVEGFAPRVQQQAMAEAVARAIDEHGQLVVEAGTGTGKSFAYLVPALLCGQKVIISTGTRHLQDQLFHRDLPTVRDALGVSARVALLKGRSNYLCLHRMDLAGPDGRRQAADLHRIQAWAGITRAGDIAELPGIPEDSPLWPRVTSTPDNCLGQECPRVGDCFVMKARRGAQEADLVVINHHLLFADMALKEEGYGELLPGANAFILDEAHQLEEVASNFFGLTLSSRQLLGLARDAQLEHQREAGDIQGLPDAARRLEKAVLDARLAFGAEVRRGPWQTVADNQAVSGALEETRVALTELAGYLEQGAPRGRGLENCWRRAQALAERLHLTTEAPPPDHVHWVETHTRAFSIHLTPLDVAPVMRERISALPSAWIFTSATLAVGQRFEHFAGRLGLDEPHTLQLESPFDYRRNALLYVPPGLPEPNGPGYTGAVVERSVAVLRASRGRAFMLFTSHRALREAAELLDGRLEYPLLVQGSAPRSELLERFRELGNAVLLGTSSFWEGVDVRGSALSCVIIDKLPFASPGEPVLQARIEALRQSGGNPFRDYQLPNAVLTLKQGIGRLIRDVNDRGVLMLCDPRLLGKPYGRIFLASLPPMSRTRALEQVEAFFAAEPGAAAGRDGPDDGHGEAG
ncbi:MAG TPA: ATP-dependent DNA helicase [Gammaproteobacteria bacterium]|nr:ATP-dependent DNA helicase [Gammaproteobacteria bacterium]